MEFSYKERERHDKRDYEANIMMGGYGDDEDCSDFNIPYAHSSLIISNNNAYLNSSNNINNNRKNMPQSSIVTNNNNDNNPHNQHLINASPPVLGSGDLLIL